jgi:hypothetical protein
MDDVEAEREMAPDVLEEDPFRAALDDDAPDVGPEVALVSGAKTAAGGAEGLARIPRHHDIHSATPASAVEGPNVVPDRSPTQGLVFHPCHESGRGVGFPLDVHQSTISGLGDVKGEIEPSGAGAEREPAQEGRHSGGM